MFRKSNNHRYPATESPLPLPRILLIATVALLALTFLIYPPVPQYNAFCAYDKLYSKNRIGSLNLQNIQWAPTRNYINDWHPLTTLSLMLDCEVSGCSSGFYWIDFYWVNIFFHLAGIFFLVLAGWRLTTQAWPSLFVGAVFALHPTHIGSVACIDGRKDVLSGFFLAVLLWLYADYCKTGKHKLYLGALAAFVLGFLSSPILLSVPILLFLLDYWPLGRMSVVSGEVKWPKFWHLVKEKLPFLLISGLFCAAVLISSHRAEPMNSFKSVPVARLSNVLLSYLNYVCRFLIPIQFPGDYRYPWNIPPLQETLSALLVLLALTFLVLRWSKSLPFLCMGWFWFGISMLPVIGFVQVGPQWWTDSYTYIPYIGLSIMVAFSAPPLARHLCPRRQALFLGGLVIAAVAAMACFTASYIEFMNTEPMINY